MLAGICNLTIEQGTSFLREFQLTQRDTLTDQVENFPLEGVTARSQIRPSHGSTAVLLDFASPEPDAAIQTVEGIWALTAPATMLQLTPGGLIRMAANEHATRLLNGTDPRYPAVWDLELRRADGFVWRVLQGSVRVPPEVTR